MCVRQVVLLSGVASADQIKSLCNVRRRCVSADCLNGLNEQVIPSIRFLFSDGLSGFQDHKAEIHPAQIV